MGSCYEGGVGDWPLCLPVNFAPNTSTVNSNSSSQEHTHLCADSSDNLCKEVCLSRVSWDLFILRPFLNLLPSSIWFAATPISISLVPTSIAHSWKGNPRRGWEDYPGWGKWNRLSLFDSGDVLDHSYISSNCLISSLSSLWPAYRK